MIAPVPTPPREQPCYRAIEGCENTVYGSGLGICCAACSADIAARLAAREQARTAGQR